MDLIPPSRERENTRGAYLHYLVGNVIFWAEFFCSNFALLSPIEVDDTLHNVIIQWWSGDLCPWAIQKQQRQVWLGKAPQKGGGVELSLLIERALQQGKPTSSCLWCFRCSSGMGSSLWTTRPDELVWREARRSVCKFYPQYVPESLVIPTSVFKHVFDLSFRWKTVAWGASANALFRPIQVNVKSERAEYASLMWPCFCVAALFLLSLLNNNNNKLSL